MSALESFSLEDVQGQAEGEVLRALALQAQRRGYFDTPARPRHGFVLICRRDSHGGWIALGGQLAYEHMEAPPGFPPDQLVKDFTRLQAKHDIAVLVTARMSPTAPRVSAGLVGLDRRAAPAAAGRTA
jgi:hypothetical protein